jgi:molybdopterin-guanine dinucleotide biosynthesis protein A
MGCEKALLRLAGDPLIVHALRILRSAGLSASIAGARAPLERFAPVVLDSEADRGPLGGICAAIASTMARHAVFLPVDLPLLPPVLARFLLEEARRGDAAVTVYSANSFTETFPAVIDRAALPWLQAALAGGHGKCLSAFEDAASALGSDLGIVPVEQALEDGRFNPVPGLPLELWFLNVNEPDDLARAEAWLAAGKAE